MINKMNKNYILRAMLFALFMGLNSVTVAEDNSDTESDACPAGPGGFVWCQLCKGKDGIFTDGDDGWECKKDGKDIDPLSKTTPNGNSQKFNGSGNAGIKVIEKNNSGGALAPSVNLLKLQKPARKIAPHRRPPITKTPKMPGVDKKSSNVEVKKTPIVIKQRQ